MAAKNTVNIQKMQSAATELDRIYSQMIKQIKTLDETMSSVSQRLRRLEVIGLCGLYASETGAPSADVHDECGQPCRRKI